MANQVMMKCSANAWYYNRITKYTHQYMLSMSMIWALWKYVKLWLYWLMNVMVSPR